MGKGCSGVTGLQIGQLLLRLSLPLQFFFADGNGWLDLTVIARKSIREGKYGFIFIVRFRLLLLVLLIQNLGNF